MKVQCKGEREDRCSHIPNNTVTIPLIFLTSHTQQLLRATLVLCLLHPLADINTDPSQCLQSCLRLCHLDLKLSDFLTKCFNVLVDLSLGV